jgi:hypothetical protein
MPLNGWENFFVAQLGASAALTGLLFVGMSINMSRIVAIPLLADRALQALSLLTTLLIASTIYLVPNVPPIDPGVGILALGIGDWAFVTHLSRRVLAATVPQYRSAHLFETGLIQFATLSWVAAGAGLLLFGDVAVYLAVPAIVATFLEVVQLSWVLLVEINR